MRNFFRDYTLIFKKDALLEARGAGIAIPSISYVIFIGVLLSLGVEVSQISLETKEKLFPSLLWLGFFVASISVVERGAWFEREYDGISGLLVCDKVSPSACFLSKSSIHFLILFFSFAALYFLSCTLMGIDARNSFEFWKVSIEGVVGFSLLCTLFSFVTVTSKMKGTLLGLVLIPLLFPLYLALTELFSEIFASGAVEPYSPWLSLLLILDVIYFIAGINLFEFIVKE